jgi:hypothetical protein
MFKEEKRNVLSRGERVWILSKQTRKMVLKGNPEIYLSSGIGLVPRSSSGRESNQQ